MMRRMRICLIATNGFTHDPRARATAAQLAAAGHEVVVVASGSPRSEPCPFPITWVPTQPPAGTALGRLRRRISPESTRRARWLRDLAEEAARSGASMFHACSEQAVPVAAHAARQAGAVVTRHPGWPDAGAVDLVSLAPGAPTANPTIVQLPYAPHTPGEQAVSSRPAISRHAGRRIGLVYRKTDTNPGRYLEDALIRAGVEVTVFTRDMTWEELAGLDAAVFVESPPPAIAISGSRPSIPVAYWAHHGEHHLASNLRLTRRYQANVVLLAHSWHLAHYFPVPVVRFPFGIAPDLFDPSMDLQERPFDVAMVGAHLRTGGPYPFRHELVNALEAHLGATRVAFEEGVPRTRMAELYGRARLVPNEGGTRHYPITMRVFEAIAARAVLWTQPVPGLDRLFTPESHFVPMRPDFVSQVDDLLARPDRLQAVADAALHHALGHHTYDHRVDELLAAVAVAPPTPASPTDPPRDSLASWIDQDVEVQRILDATALPLSEEMPDREIWPVTDHPEPTPGSFGAVALDGTTEATEPLLAAARKYIYGRGVESDLRSFVDEHAPHSEILTRGELLRVDLLPGRARGTISS